MKREMRVKELKMLDGARQRFMQHHQQVKEAELKRLDDEIKRKVCEMFRYIHRCSNHLTSLMVQDFT